LGRYNTLLAGVRGARKGPLAAGSDRRQRASSFCASVNFDGRPMCCPRSCGYRIEFIAYLDSSTVNATLDHMEIHLAPDQEAHLAALAARAGRSTDELVQEAVAMWEEQQAERQAPRKPQHTPAEAAARILELRKGNILPAGETIKDLINHGRA
jgi:hypothetical protein